VNYRAWAVTALIVVLCFTALSYYWLTVQFAPVSPDASIKKSFVVVPNQTAAETISKLKSQSLIRSSLAARIYLKWTGLDQKLRPGSYVLSPSQNLKELFTSLAAGPTDIWVTIPEGWRREQIASRLDSTLSGPTKLFDAQAFIDATATLEGQLFPDSYLVPRDISTPDVITMLTRTFKTKSGLNLPSDAPTLVLASLIEREAKSDQDRPIIAGILTNRLQANWPLQVDATVQFAQDNATCKSSPNCKYWTPVVTTKLTSQYNTYQKPGLPPSPICNPGLSAINAAKSPQATQYWYYIHDSQGQPHYATSLAEHELNIDKYLRL
jgi:UPF0755 protein